MSPYDCWGVESRVVTSTQGGVKGRRFPYRWIRRRETFQDRWVIRDEYSEAVLVSRVRREAA